MVPRGRGGSGGKRRRGGARGRVRALPRRGAPDGGTRSRNAARPQGRGGAARAAYRSAGPCPQHPERPRPDRLLPAVGRRRLGPRIAPKPRAVLSREGRDRAVARTQHRASDDAPGRKRHRVRAAEDAQEA